MNSLEVRGPRQLRVKGRPESKQRERTEMKTSMDRIQTIETRNQKKTASQPEHRGGLVVGIHLSDEVFYRTFEYITDNVLQHIVGFPGRSLKIS